MLGLGCIGSIIIGIIAGFLASKIMKGGDKGCLMNLILGIVGGFVGGYLFQFLGIEPRDSVIGALVTATVGAVFVLWLASLIKK